MGLCLRNFKDFEVTSKLIHVALFYKFYQFKFWNNVDENIVFAMPNSSSFFNLDLNIVERYLRSMVMLGEHKFNFSEESCQTILDHFESELSQFLVVDDSQV